MGKALANKYRPKTFDDVVGQDYVKTILRNQLASGEFKNAYLFTGGAGTGKTTIARIVANEMNDGKGSPIEIDGASNNGVDNIREIIDSCKFQSLDSKYKIFILDEVHMLSIGAFNALLKTLEEPPANTIFILCTTDPQKIPATILSRVQRFQFTRIPTDSIVQRLIYILEKEQQEMPEGTTIIDWTDDALEYIAKLANGGMRDSITMLDKVLDYDTHITEETVVTALGAPDYEVFFDLLTAILNGDTNICIRIVEENYLAGKDMKLFIRNFTDVILDTIKYGITDDLDLTSLPASCIEQLNFLVEPGTDDLVPLLGDMNNLCNLVKWESNPKAIIEGELIMQCNSNLLDKQE